MATDSQALINGPGWVELPAVAVGRLAHYLRPCSRAAVRRVCRRWRAGAASSLQSFHVGPGDDCAEAAAGVSGPGLSGIIQHVYLAYSSCREYRPTIVEDVLALLHRLPSLEALVVAEVLEVEGDYHLGTPHTWQVLVEGGPLLSPRLRSLVVDSCFWQHGALFSCLAAFTGLTELRLLNVPLETAAELGVVAGLGGLKALEFGVIYDGDSSDHDVPQALEGIGALTQLRELSLPIWRRSLGGRAHPLAPALSAALAALTGLVSLSVDGKFNQLGVVSSLTALTALRSASPLSAPGWQVLGSLTPPGHPLRSSTPLPAGDLVSGLAAARHLRALDVTVVAAGQVAGVGGCSALTSLTVRGLKQFSSTADVAATLRALRSLPASLQALLVNSLVPLSDELLGVLAAACPHLQALHLIDTPSGVATATSSQQQQGNPVVSGAAAGSASSVPLLPGPPGPDKPLAHPLQQLTRLTSLTFEAGAGAASSDSGGEGGGGLLQADLERQVLAGYAICVDQLPPRLTRLSLVGPWRLCISDLYHQPPWSVPPGGFEWSNPAPGSFSDQINRLKLGSGAGPGSGGMTGAVVGLAAAAAGVQQPTAGAGAAGAAAAAAGDVAGVGEVQQGSPDRRQKRPGSALQQQLEASAGEYPAPQQQQQQQVGGIQVREQQIHQQQQEAGQRPDSPAAPRTVKRQKSQSAFDRAAMTAAIGSETAAAAAAGGGAAAAANLPPKDAVGGSNAAAMPAAAVAAVSRPVMGRPADFPPSAAAATATTAAAAAAPWSSHRGPQDSVAIAVAMAVAQTSRHTLPYSHGQTASVFDQAEPSAVAASTMQPEEEDGDSMGLHSSDYLSQGSSGAMGDTSDGMGWSTAAAPRRMTDMEDVGDVGAGVECTAPAAAAAAAALQTGTAASVAAVLSLPVLSGLQLVSCGAQPGAVAALLAASYGCVEELVLGDVLLLLPEGITPQLPAQRAEAGQDPLSQPAATTAAGAGGEVQPEGGGAAAAVEQGQVYLQASLLLQLPVHWPALVQLQVPGHVLWELAAAAAAAAAQHNSSSSSSSNQCHVDLWHPLLQSSAQNQQQRHPHGPGSSDTRPTMYHLQRVTVNSSRHLVFVSPSEEAAQQLREVVTRSLQQVPHLRHLTLTDTGMVVASSPAAWAAATSYSSANIRSSNGASLSDAQQQQQQQRWGRVVPVAALQARGWAGQQEGWDWVVEQLLATLPRCRISVTSDSVS